MLVEEVQVLRKVGIDNESRRCACQHPDDWSPLEATFRPADDRHPDEHRQDQQHKHVVSKCEDEGERTKQPILFLEEQINSGNEIDDCKRRGLGHV